MLGLTLIGNPVLGLHFALAAPVGDSFIANSSSVLDVDLLLQCQSSMQSGVNFNLSTTLQVEMLVLHHCSHLCISCLKVEEL